MKILAIDSSAAVASVALMDDENMVGEYTINYKKTHSQTLLPMIDELKKMTGFEVTDLDAIAIAEGPGSFTGLRIGEATAKGIALAAGLPIIGVPTVDALACNLCFAEGLVVPLMDARRSQVYTGIYRFDGGRLERVRPQWASPVEDLISILNELGERVVFLGDGVPVYRRILEEGLKVPYFFAPPAHSRQRAGAVGMLALAYAAEGKMEGADEHVPNYLRPSQAERERAQRLEGDQDDSREPLLLEPRNIG